VGIRQKLGERIKAAREERRITQQVLADVLEVNRAVISDWENGKTSPNLDRMDVLAAFLRKPISYFFTESTEMEGHQVENPAFYVQAYSKTVQRLREMELELRRQATGLKVLRQHFISQATLLLDRLTPEERKVLEDTEMDPYIKDISSLPARVRDSKRKHHASTAFATVNGLSRLMEEVELDGMDHERSLFHLVRVFLRRHDGETPWGEYEAEARRIFREALGDRFTVVPLRRIVNCIDNVSRAELHGIEPEFRLEEALEAARTFAQSPASDDAISPEATASTVAEHTMIGGDTIDRVSRIAAFWKALHDELQLKGIPF
jgi:transcriptional regulator with XRE-family HTH domain